ncbi:Zinc finger CCHC domain-containing protein 8 [Halotydeus destructor]|nr:Zinc finger CCHC domain-containing protein 8 [Halotydeus destructor]
MAPKRYFDELSSGVKAGRISKELQEALGLHSDKLPIWIYRMRVLGYPPGWLKTADMSSSVVDLIDGDSPRSPKRQALEANIYNPESLVIYPGFNAPLPEGVSDHHDYLGMPAMQPFQQLTYATGNMKRPKPKPFKRVKISSSSLSFADSPSSPVAPTNCPTNTDDEKEPEVILLSDEEDDIRSNDSVTVLSSTTNGLVNKNGSENELSKIESMEETKTQPINVVNSNDKNGSENELLKSDNSVVEFSSPATKLIAVGSPVPESYKTAKPPLEKWSENNSLAEMIYFENLPDSTGVFDRLRSVLGRVRNKLFSNQES